MKIFRQIILIFLVGSVLFSSHSVYARRIRENAFVIPRLTAEAAIERYGEMSSQLQDALQKFKDSLSGGINILKEEGMEAFREKAWPDIEDKISAVRAKMGRFKELAPYIGFTDAKTQAAVDKLLADMARRFNADKIVLYGKDFLAYSYGLDEKEYVELVKALNTLAFNEYCWARYRGQSEIEMEPLLSVIRKTGIVSFINDGKNVPMNSGIYFVIGRSQSLIDRLGDFNAEDTEAMRVFLEENTEAMASQISGSIDYVLEDLLHKLSSVRHDFFSNGFIAPSRLWEIIIQKEQDVQELLKFLEIMEEAVNTYQFLNTRYFELFRSQTKKEPVEVKSFLSELLKSQSQIAKTKGLDFKVKLMDENPVLMIEKELLMTVISNVVGNAIKYTPSGSVIVECSIENNHILKITVSDTGIGIPEAELDLITEGHRASNVGYIEGTGFGLPEVSALLSAVQAGHFAGYLEIHSEEGKGTIVTITIPYDEE